MGHLITCIMSAGHPVDSVGHLGSKKRDRVVSGSRYSGKTVLPLMVNTLGLYVHAIRGSGRCYVLDIILCLLQMSGINNELEIYNI